MLVTIGSTKAQMNVEFTGETIEIKTSDFYADEDFCEKSTFNISSGNFIKISIKDNGSGMTKEVKEKIFEPFFTTKSVGKGTGLGLAAVYGTIIDYKGFIEVESEINKGTSISLFIPATESIKKLIVNKQRTVMKKYTGTILLVEDEDVVRDVAHNLLTKLGFETLVAENGKEAVDIFKKHESKISLVVMDIVMPVMDGREAFYELKEINKDVKVILLSGFKREASINSLLEEGVKGFLQKPYTIQAFREKVVEVLGQ